MNKLLLLGIIILIPLINNAQETSDSLKQKSVLGIKEKFPRARVLNFEYGQSLNRDFDSELFGQAFQEGKIKAQRSFNASANIPIYRTRKWSLTGSLNYKFNEFEFDNVESTGITVFEQNGIVNFHDFSTAISSTYFSLLFKKPVIYNASLIVDGNDNGFERLKGLLGMSFILKRTERTTITLGAIVFVDPTSQLPFFPTFSFNHRFKNSKWEVDFILPQRLLLRRFVGENGRFSIGSSFGATGFYVNVDNPDFANVFEYSQLEIKSGIIYEHRFTNYLIGTFQGGLQNFISNRLTEKGEPTEDFIYKNKQDATGYFQIGISIDPFAKRKK
ncbi:MULTISPECIES: hypothetical protein [Bizionia]|uniref:DUF4421 domain-containing protein n=1 Tax=Bizionia algoritergicola TaxID=291187 RepID=A0A5D0R180_9FLAO|nr:MULTISPECIES: hypothetical protein [Bizionia]OBX22487.1 hypothetical protein BAA08_08660 [Bizionia sp. APA-3]TYB74611.1 hypothetical protein ES675_00260 [Bizionia algoritergicola]